MLRRCVPVVAAPRSLPLLRNRRCARAVVASAAATGPHGAVQRRGIWSIRDDLVVPRSPYFPVEYAAGQERGPSPLVMKRFQSVISQLFQHRIIRCGGPVEDDMANIIVAQLLYLDAIDPTKDIIMYVNSPGGSVTAGMAIFDTMKHIRPDVSTVCIGLAASMGAFLLSTGTKGKRYSLPNSRIMIHQPLGGAQGQETDLEIQANEMLHHKANLNGYLAYHTGSAPRCLSSLLLPEAGKTLSVRKWQAAFSPDGCLDIASVLSWIQRGGVHPTVRGEVWEFLLGCFDPRSTFDEREEEIRQIRRYLPSLKSTWCAILVILKKYLSIYYL